MCEYIKWIFNPDNINTNIFTVISVVLSGLISWGISAIYFSRGNRNNLRASVLCPIRRLLENNPITNENYRKLAEYTKDYSMKYLKSREHPIVDELLSAYQEVCRYKYEYVCAESLQSYFNYKLKKNKPDAGLRRQTLFLKLIFLLLLSQWFGQILYRITHNQSWFIAN